MSQQLQDRCIASAIRFLSETRVNDEYWTDFGGSVEWVTAYVTAQIQGISSAAPLRRSAQAFLGRRFRGDGGVGFGPWYPSDCDSTAWCLLAWAGEYSDPRADKAREFLLSRRQTTGYVTYHPSLASSSAPHARKAWFAPQPCVTAAAVQALTTLPPAPAWPSTLQEQDARALRAGVTGESNSCWWDEPNYVRLHAIRALKTLTRLDEPLARNVAAEVEAALEHAEQQSSFALALLIRLGLTVAPAGVGLSPKIQQATTLLHQRQHPDGSWASGAVLQVPEGDGAKLLTVHDTARVFSTASIVAALAEVAVGHPRFH